VSGSATATLTVVSDALSVSIFTDALIEVTDQSYAKTYTVQVVDSSGSAKGGVEISKSVDILRYFKGEWRVVGDKWVKNPHILPADNVTCDNEDLNRNGVLETYSNGAVEDANGTGVVEPRKADIAISFVGSSSTDSSGQVKLKITYGQNVASWLQFNILVAASGVAGTEGRTSYQGVLPVLAAAVADAKVEPAFRLGPYGTQPSPVVLTTNPAGQSGLLCTNKNAGRDARLWQVHRRAPPGAASGTAAGRQRSRDREADRHADPQLVRGPWRGRLPRHRAAGHRRALRQ
jgi:hypothetical protein